jgi:hypothetical protein
MKPRPTAYRISPIHIHTGAMAPAIHSNADSYEQAKKEVAKTSTLFKRFPDVWRLI